MCARPRGRRRFTAPVCVAGTPGDAAPVCVTDTTDVGGLGRCRSRSGPQGAVSTQRLCVSQTHLAVEVARSRSRPPRVGRAAASCRLGPARHAGCQVHIAPHAEHTVGPQQGRLGLCPQEQRGTRHTGREHQRSWSLPGIQLQNVLPGESTSAAGLFPRYTGREHQRSWSLPVIAAAEPRGGAGPVGAAGADLVGAAAAAL